VPVALPLSDLFVGAAGFVVDLVARDDLAEPAAVVKFGVPRAFGRALLFFVVSAARLVRVAAPLAALVNRLDQLFVWATRVCGRLVLALDVRAVWRMLLGGFHRSAWTVAVIVQLVPRVVGCAVRDDAVEVAGQGRVGVRVWRCRVVIWVVWVAAVKLAVVRVPARLVVLPLAANLEAVPLGDDVGARDDERLLEAAKRVPLAAVDVVALFLFAVPVARQLHPLSLADDGIRVPLAVVRLAARNLVGRPVARPRDGRVGAGVPVGHPLAVPVRQAFALDREPVAPEHQRFSVADL